MKDCKMITYKPHGGHEMAIPLCTVQGGRNGPTVCITAGMHGCEYPGIAAAVALAKQINPDDVRGTIKILTISNLPSFEQQRMYEVPYDRRDEYDLFPGSPTGSYSEVLVDHIVEDVIRGSDYYIDLHGGDLIEDLLPLSLVHISGRRETDVESLRLAESFGLPVVVATNHHGKRPDMGKIYAGIAELGIPSVLAEAGRIGLLEESAVAMHTRGLTNVLRHVGSLEGTPTANQGILRYDDWYEVRSPEQGIFYNATRLGDVVRKGQVIGAVEDYFGREKCKVRASSAGRILVQVTSPAVAQNGLLMLVGLGEPRDLNPLQP
jgi:predicted deacylase